ncbi:MAG TPA: twin-arginine translocase TatA/TatE family subunit [Kofleriaceae bacterium]
MFGIGGSEILVILVIALLFLGPDKLPEAAKTISKGIRDLKKQSRALQQQIEGDEKIGGAIRDLKSALRGEDAPIRPPVRIEPPKIDPAEQTEPSGPEAGELGSMTRGAALEEGNEAKPVLTLPDTAGERDHDDFNDDGSPVELGSLIKPAAGTVAKTEAVTEPAGDDAPKQKHG